MAAFEPQQSPLGRVFAEHPRLWRDFTYVYPVVSRRSQGMSVGVNLNPNKVCNFDCVYCCVDRTIPGPVEQVDLADVARELDAMLTLVTSGAIWDQPEFEGVDPSYRRLNDIAFSGDGEPTLFKQFDEAVRLAADAKVRFDLPDVKIIVITNATNFTSDAVQRGLSLIDESGGEVWAKLDAGTQPYYELIDRSRVSLERVLASIAACGRDRPVVIQTLLMRVDGEAMSDGEFDAYAQRVAELVDAGCEVSRVQLYTVARRTAEVNVSPLSNSELDERAQTLRERLPGMRVDVYYGVGG